MRVSEHYGLSLSQGELDFVDVEIRGDTPLFLDPAALRQMRGEWAHECIALIQDFFQAVIDAIRAGQKAHAIDLISGLREPNETRLGLSSGQPRGRALGPGSAEITWDALQRSEATRTGLLMHLEDTALLVRGIGPDIVSDIATNLMRAPLITYTQDMASHYGIPLVAGVATGPLWDPGGSQWAEGRLVPMPLPDRRLLLVPKTIVRRHMAYDTVEYLNNFILPVLENREVSANTELVRTIKYNGAKNVAKKDLVAKYGAKKEDIIRVTLEEDGDPLDRYRVFREANPTSAPRDLEFAEATGAAPPDWDQLLSDLDQVPTGANGADAFHRAVERLLTAIFSSSLAYPYREYPIHQGRKRVDISYSNAGVRDFFSWVAQHHPAANVFVECKNYSGDPANPELDQLAGRFSPSRGRVGILCCRRFENKDRFVQRCRDTALDDRGFIIALDDGDLRQLADLRRRSAESEIYTFLKRRFDELT